MSRRTRILLALSGIAVGAVILFLLGPALFPGLDPSEEVSKGSDAKIRAQDTASSTAVTSECTYSDAGDVRTVYSDGAELFKFHGGHRIEVEAPLARSDRSAITTYGDGTVRMEIFEVGTTVRQMAQRVPLKTRWFKPDGSPRSKPGVGEYPELWDKVGEFTTSGDSPTAHIGPDHPWKEIWPGVEPPGLDEGDEDIFGPVRRVWRDPNQDQIWTYFADKTVKVSGRGSALYENRGVQIVFLYYPDGSEEYYYLGRDEGYPSLCPDTRQEITEGVVRYVKIKYQDGLARIFYIRGSVNQTELSQAERFCEVWERNGERVDPPSDLDEYPVRDLPARQTPPPELFQ